MSDTFITDLVSALGKAASGLEAIANLSKSERAKYRQVMDDTYRLIDTTLNMVILRLGDILSEVEITHHQLVLWTILSSR